MGCSVRQDDINTACVRQMVLRQGVAAADDTRDARSAGRGDIGVR